MRVLDLFSGIGGFSLGLERAGMETVAFCEIEPFCQKVLAKHWPDVPIYSDIRTLTAERLKDDGINDIGLVCGGFPCQDISSAGKKVGIRGSRSGLWSEMFRLVCEIQPETLLVENTAGILARGIDTVLGDLASIGYDCVWTCIPASAVGAPHGRDRCWIVGNPNDKGESNRAINDEAQVLQKLSSDDATYPERRQREVGRYLERIGRVGQSVEEYRIWEFENSPFGMGVDDGVSNRMDRLKALGNAVVPQVVEVIGRAIMATEDKD